MSQGTRPLGYHQISVWSMQMQVMLNAGVPLLEALRTLARSEVPLVSVTSEQLGQKLRQGKSLSEAMRSLDPAFSPFVSNLVLVGETTGKLPAVLERISVRSARRAKTERAIASALAYPVCLAAISIAMALCMAFYMFPRLLPFLIGLGVPLPWPTRVLIWLTDNAAWIVLTLTVLAAYSGRLLASSNHPRVARIRGWLLYRSPVLGALNAERVYADTLDDLHLLLEVRCEILRGLKTLRTPWPDLQDRIESCIDLVRAGTPFSEAAHLSGMLPDRFAVQIRSGEESGKMARMFQLLAQQLDESVTMRTEQLVQMLEPTILLGMGVVAGFVVVATFLPLYAMATASL